MRLKKFAAIALFAVPVLGLTACSSPPPEADVHKAVVDTLVGQGAPEDLAQKFADCATPKMMDQISAKGLNNIVDDGIDAKGTEEDLDDMKAITSECQSAMTG